MGLLSDLSNITWALITVMVVLILYFHGPSYSVQTVRTAPSILTSFGIFGTFLGIAFGLMQFDSANIQSSVPVMIDGLGVAVWSSVVGILGALSIRLRHAINSVRRAAKSETQQVTIADLNNAILSLNESMQGLRSASRDRASSLLQSNQTY